MTKTLGSLIGIACLFLILACGIPALCYSTWTGVPTAFTGLLKTLELLLWLGFAGCIAGIGGVLITSSDKGHMEWLGTVCVLIAGSAIGVMVFLRGTSIDEFASYRNLVSQRSTSSLATKPEIKYDWSTGTLNYKVSEQYIWICVSVDYINGDPLPRESMVLYTFKADTDGFGTYQVPTDLIEKVERVGVSYGTGSGPSVEAFLKKAEAPKTVDPGAPAGPAPTI